MKSRYSLILLTMGLGLTLALILLWTLGDGSVLAAAARVPASFPTTDRTLKPSWAGMVRGAVEGPPVTPSAPATVTELYVCDTCLYTTVQAAVDAADSGDVVKVATGVYTGVSVRYGMTQVVYIDKAVVIRGGYTTSDWDHADPEANPVTLDAEGWGRALYATLDVSITLEGLRFTAVITPSGASELITYTWMPGPDSGQGTDSVSYTWPTTGTKVITLAAENCGGTFEAIHTIVISAAPQGCPKPLTNVGITGPTSGYTGTAYGFAAVITPSDATKPLSYSWTPEPISGQGTDEATFTWATTGNKTVSVEVENCGGSASDDHTVSIRGRSDEFVYLPLVLRSQ